MARAEQLPADLGNIIPQIIGDRVRQIVSGGTSDQIFPDVGEAVDKAVPTGSPLQLAESFPLWMLAIDISDAGTADLRKLAQPIGRWHHQIQLSTGKLAYARSAQSGTKSGPSGWRVREIVEGPLAEQVSKAIELIDRNFPDEYVVRLLSVPSYIVNAFWIVNDETGDQQLLFLTPVEVADQFANRFLDPPTFLAALRGWAPAEGVIDDFSLGAAGDASVPFGRIAEVTIQITIRPASKVR
jgi:hypothetical protein